MVIPPPTPHYIDAAAFEQHSSGPICIKHLCERADLGSVFETQGENCPHVRDGERVRGGAREDGGVEAT